MSVFGLERSETGAANSYDHAINLIDTTRPKEEQRETSDNGSLTATDGGNGLGRQSIKGQGALRKELARRKYAKYQQSKEDDGGGPTESGSEAGNSIAQDSRPSQEIDRTGRRRYKVPFRSKKKAAKASKGETSFIDVLYENQRGSFFCGIPLYSSNSLLNFDPSPWQTANFQDSAVNITNFQLPDPSWMWDWKTWYVDMSHDVDEEGWEYSFSFNKAYSWHGNHPWLFSFARRRRWLRKRVKINAHPAEEKKKGRIDQAHLLNQDYFTIHAPRRDRSRDSSVDRSTTNWSSYMNGRDHDSDDEQHLEEIINITELMKALRRARVDREKIAAVKAFLDHGSDELFYLADSIPEIMSMFVYQTSRRQLQSYLLQSLDEATKSCAEDSGKGKQKSNEDPATNGEPRRRKIDNLLKAVHAAGVHVSDLEFCSDLRARATSSETGPTNETRALDATEPTTVPEDGPHSHSEDDEVPAKEEIKGIPDDAHVSEEPRLQFATSGADSANDENESLDKGKGRA